MCGIPVTLLPADYNLWIESGFHGQRKLTEMLKPSLGEDMGAYSINTLVNNPRNEDAKCIKAVGTGG